MDSPLRTLCNIIANTCDESARVLLVHAVKVVTFQQNSSEAGVRGITPGKLLGLHFAAGEF